MAIIGSSLLLREFFCNSPFPRLRQRIPIATAHAQIGFGRICCTASESGDAGEKKVSARLSKMQQILQDAKERAISARSEPTPKITIGPGRTSETRRHTATEVDLKIIQNYKNPCIKKSP